MTYYGDDWFLMDHPEFEDMMHDLGIWKGEPTDSSKVPSRKVWKLYLDYQKLPAGSDKRYQFRLDNPTLDAWGVASGIWTSPAEPRQRHRGSSISDEQADIYSDQIENQRMLEELGALIESY